MDPLNSAGSKTANSTSPVTTIPQVIQPSSQNNNSDVIKSIITIVALFFVFPVGVILMWVLTHWPKWVKSVITLIIPVVVIAILAVVGLTVFSANQKGARDALKRADIQSISQALELHYGTEQPYMYPAIKPEWFASKSIPNDPNTGNYYNGTPTIAARSFKICTNLELTPSFPYCVSSPH